MRFIKYMIRQFEPDVVVFDNLHSLTDGDKIKSDTWNELKPLCDWIAGHGIAQIWIDHASMKNGEYRYGSDTQNWTVDKVIRLDRKDHPEEDGLLCLTFDFSDKNRDLSYDNIDLYKQLEKTVVWLGKDGWHHKAKGAMLNKDTKANRLKKLIISYIEEKKCRPMIIEGKLDKCHQGVYRDKITEHIVRYAKSEETFKDLSEGYKDDENFSKTIEREFRNMKKDKLLIFGTDHDGKDLVAVRLDEQPKG